VQVAQLYEQQMNEENRIQVLPIALFHFERTGNIFKRILFLEGMASIHMANGLYADGTRNEPDPFTNSQS